MASAAAPALDVVVGLILDRQGRVLVSQRTDGTHMEGFWEFPGGKRGALEGRREALDRELDEELGIRILKAQPLMVIGHDYPDRCVWLDVWVVQTYEGEPAPRERQSIAWILPQDLGSLKLLPADQPIIEALLDWTPKSEPEWLLKRLNWGSK